MKQHAPATERNRAPIAEVLARELPVSGTVLEIAAGTGEHAVFFAGAFPALVWQPTDPSPEALASIAAYRADYPGDNLAAPLLLDAAAPDAWPVARAAAVVCINMVHISPWEATLGLFRGAARLLGSSGGPLILYGPYIEQGVETAPSNLDFDGSLKARTPSWGLRKAEEAQAEAQRALEEYRAALASAREEAAAIRTQAQADRAAIVEEARTEARAAAAAVTAQAEAQLAAERAQATSQLTRQVGEVAVALAGKVVGQATAVEPQPAAEKRL